MQAQSWLVLLRSSDVHGLHTHGAPGQEAEPEPSRAGTRAGEGHGQHERPARPRPQEEREEVLLRGRRSSLSTRTENIETRLGNVALGHQSSVSDTNVWILTAPSYDTTTGQSALLNVTQAEGLTVCQHWLHITARRLKDHSGVFEF